MPPKKSTPIVQKTPQELTASPTLADGFPTVALESLPIYDHEILVMDTFPNPHIFDRMSRQGWEHYFSHLGGKMDVGSMASQGAVTHYFRRPATIPKIDCRAGKRS